MPTDDPLDPAAFERLRRLGGDNLLVQMIDIFLDFVPKKITQTLDGQKTNHLPGIEQGAHAIKSSAGHVGARRLHDLATEIERLARERQSAALPTLLSDLESEFVRVRTSLIEHQRNLSNSAD
jgi:HPt (histidine-containing phosphotransfer) domain-containing protein